MSGRPPSDVRRPAALEPHVCRFSTLRPCRIGGMENFNYEAVRDLLRCPKTHAELAYTGDALVSCDPDARLRYPIVDGFPVLLIDEATELPALEWSSLMTACGRDPVTGAAASGAPPKG